MWWHGMQKLRPFEAHELAVFVQSCGQRSIPFVGRFRVGVIRRKVLSRSTSGILELVGRVTFGRPSERKWWRCGSPGLVDGRIAQDVC
jgi:hypothetical protein